MKTQKHISEYDLKQVILEQRTEAPQQVIESHVSDCQLCQSRLLEMAADETWREEFSSSIQEFHGLEEDSLETGEFPKSDSPVGDEYDLLTVDQMLSEVLQPPVHPEMLGRLDRYDIESVLGCGGMGVVLRGFDRDLHRPVAIKMVLPRLSRNGTAKQRFEREACAAAAVLHPNVIAIHGISKSAGVPWFVMPLVAGPSLGKLVQSQGPLPEREIVRIGMQIASGLAAAHSQGLVHRDIKPANILIDNQINRVVITDFGLARRESEESMTQTGMLAGTLNYMSPEQSRGEDIDARSDLFSLGSLLFYLAAGVVPFKSDSAMRVLHKIGNEKQPDVQSINPEISATLSSVINRLLEKQPANRFQNAVELESFFNDYLAHLNHPTKTVAPQFPKNARQADRKILHWTIATLGVALLAGMMAWWGPSMMSFSTTENSEESGAGTSQIQKGNKNIGPSNENVVPTHENTRPTTARLTFRDIQQRYDLGDSNEFDETLVNLGREVSSVHFMMNQSEFEIPVGDLDRDLENLSRELQRLGGSIELRSPAQPDND